MLDTTNIVRLRIKKDKELDQYRKENREALQELGPIKRKKFTKIRDLIYDITKTIEKESGWMYTPDKFTIYTDYRYTNDKIEFKTNTITSDEDGYHLSDTPTPKEFLFFNRYQELLTRLFELEQKRKEMLPKKYPNVISFTDFQTKEDRIKENQGNILMNNFINALSIEFVQEYKREGIMQLVKLLNVLTDSTDVMNDYYSLDIRNNVLSQELLRFAGLYTPRGQQVLDELARIKLEKEYMLSGFPSYEERMTKNMIDLHL